MKRVLFSFLLVAFSIEVMAQSVTRDVVTLKNGSVVKGSIIEMKPNESVKVSTSDGSIFVYNMSEIEQITKEGIAPDYSVSATSREDEDMCSKATSDAIANYHGQGALVGATYATTLITSPLIGLIPAAIGASSEPQPSNLNVPDQKKYYNNTEYRNCYNQQAKKIKSNKAWGGYAGASLTWLGLVLVTYLLLL